MQKLLALLGAKNKEEFVELFKQFVKFGLVGVSNTAVSMAVSISSCGSARTCIWSAAFWARF